MGFIEHLIGPWNQNNLCTTEKFFYKIRNLLIISKPKSNRKSKKSGISCKVNFPNLKITYHISNGEFNTSLVYRSERLRH